MPYTSSLVSFQDRYIANEPHVSWNQYVKVSLVLKLHNYISDDTLLELRYINAAGFAFQKTEEIVFRQSGYFPLEEVRVGLCMLCLAFTGNRQEGRIILFCCLANMDSCRYAHCKLPPGVICMQ